MIVMVAPSFFTLILLRIVANTTLILIDCTPFIKDYVKKESRAKAVAFNSVAVGISQVLVTQVFLLYSNTVSYKEAFTKICIGLGSLSVMCVLMIREKTPK